MYLGKGIKEQYPFIAVTSFPVHDLEIHENSHRKRIVFINLYKYIFFCKNLSKYN